MNGKGAKPKRLRDDPATREDLVGRLAALGWALWSLFLVEFVVKLVLAPIRRRYLREHWLDALIVLLPFLRVLRLARVVQTARGLPAFRLLVFGGRGSQPTLALLKRRRIGQLAIISAMVILIGATLGFLLETGAPGARIQDFGDSLWWSAALVTTVRSELYPVTAAGRVLGVRADDLCHRHLHVLHRLRGLRARGPGRQSSTENR